MRIVCLIPSICSPKIINNLNRCLESLKLAEKEDIKLFKVVVTENRHYRTKRKGLGVQEIIIVEKGTGFGEKNNMGIEVTLNKLKPDYYLLINDDAWVEKNFFSEFLKFLKRHHPDLLNPIVYFGETKQIDSFGVEYFTSGYAKNAYSEEIQTQLATASCLLVKSEFLREIGEKYGFYFNPLLYFYLEDVEFSIRARALGGKIMRNSRMIAHHVGSFTSGKKSYFTLYYSFRNLIWLILITWPLKTILKRFLSILFLQCLVFIYGILNFGLFFYIKLLISTARNFKRLKFYRKQTISRYIDGFEFDSLLSKYALRKQINLTVKL